MGIQISLLLYKALQRCQVRVLEPPVLTTSNYPITSETKRLGKMRYFDHFIISRGGIGSNFREGKSHQTWFAVKLINCSLALAMSRK